MWTIEEEDNRWYAFDAFGLADRELRDADLLLRDRRGSGLKAHRVKGANNPHELVRLVPVSGWRPVETLVHISDIPRIIETFGGASLYGDDTTAPLRELLQIAMDAIQARRWLQDRKDWGLIRVGLSSKEDGVWLSVEDNGVGMSERVLTGALLDFGSSFWRSAQMMAEFPTLAARGMNAIGRFGIGFFSVFMLGEEVRVTTRRYDRGEQTRSHSRSVLASPPAPYCHPQFPVRHHLTAVPGLKFGSDNICALGRKFNSDKKSDNFLNMLTYPLSHIQHPASFIPSQTSSFGWRQLRKSPLILWNLDRSHALSAQAIGVPRRQR